MATNGAVARLAASLTPPSQTYVVFVCTLGGSWLEGNFLAFLALLMELPSNSRTTQTQADAALTRHCVSFVLRSTLTSLLGEKAQISAATQLSLTMAAHKHASGEPRSVPLIFERAVKAAASAASIPGPLPPLTYVRPLVCPEAAPTGGNSEARVSYAEVAASQHLLVCCLQELGGLLLRLGSTASSLLTDGSTGLSSSHTRTHVRTKGGC